MVKEPGEDGWDVGEYARAGVPGRRIRRKSPRPRSKPREWREDEGEGRRKVNATQPGETGEGGERVSFIRRGTGVTLKGCIQRVLFRDFDISKIECWLKQVRKIL